ncbi:putative bifunctional diguanylate cyclase/phosphodiesterase [Gemmatimonas phototrophica]|uniref:putative bifunctional diguanylate cyclase/phosphodiesterase n=1 Tax=Gemmatimonas phototrophica TaxID=1379270 RepID=UPI0006A6BAE8|nr:EAL domain-containing protein [Gemmatimonas phototrophica]
MSTEISTERRRSDWDGETRNPARVLLIDDDQDIHNLVSAMLRPLGVQLESAFDGTSGVTQAMNHPPELILLDQELPDATGVELLKRLQGEPLLANVPVIIVTGTERRDVLTACFAGGASDYIRKPFFGAELRARVQSVIDRQRMLAELGRAAHVDSLTGLPNRSLLHLRLQHSIDRARENPAYGFAVMFIDFDRFKLINDSLGHEVGDQLLVEIARRLRHNLRAQDCITRDSGGTTVARLGGDEFVVILDDVPTVDMATAIAERLLPMLEQPYALQAHTVRTSASVGIVHSSSEYVDSDNMLRDADIAMYEAKARGKNCYVIFTPFMREAIHNRVRLENALRDGIGTDQFFLVYQPIISLDDRRVHSVEVLVRWRHPDLGLISPGAFIPIAEETRLILPLSDQVLRQACLQFVQWQREMPTLAPDYISVNLSRVQLADPTVAARTMAILEETGMSPQCLQLEVTESQLMQHRAMALDLLTTFKREGIRLAMDDFGTGYSSLSCLQEYPFDVLKVDRALTENVSRGRGYSALLHAVMTLADNLGLEVVAEGIEHMEQLVLLQALGCPYGQGYLLARPLEARVFEEWMGSPSAISMEAA